MIDPRLQATSRRNRDTQTREVNALAVRIDGELPALATLARAAVAHRLHLPERLEAPLPPESAGPAVTSEADPVRRALLTWARNEAFDERVEGWLAGRLIGRALAAQAVESRLALEPLLRLYELTSQSIAAFEAFEASFTEACRADAQLRAHYVGVLTALPRNAEDWLPSYERERSHGRARVYAEPKRMRQAWAGTGRWFPIDDRVRLQLSLLLRIDTLGFTQAIEATPAHALRDVALDAVGIHRDRDRLLELLSIAAPVFEGDAWTGRDFALLLLDSVVDHLRALHHAIDYEVRGKDGLIIGQPNPADPALKEFREQEAPQLIKAVLDALFRRTDGERLATEWSVELTSRAVHEPVRLPRSAWGAATAAMEVVLDQLAARVVRVDRLREIGKAPTGQETTTLLADLVAAAYTDHARAQGLAAADVEPRAIWDWYSDLLRREDEGLEFHVSTMAEAPPWVFLSIASALARLPSADEAWTNTWADLQRQRFANPPRATPSWHLLRVGRAALQWFAQNGRTDQGRDLWRLLADATAKLRVATADRLSRDPVEKQAALFAYIPALWGNERLKILGEQAGLLRADDDLCLRAAVALTHNGVTPGDVRAEFTALGIDPVGAGQREVRWLKRVKDNARSPETYERWLASLAPEGLPS